MGKHGTHGTDVLSVRCADITVGERYRKAMGDIDELAKSIELIGLLQPIGITDDDLLVFGERRLRAFRDVLRRETIPARIISVDSLIAAERIENEFHLPFLQSERVAIGRACEAEIKERRGRPSADIVQLVGQYPAALRLPLSLQKACVDDYGYTLKLRTGEVFNFTFASYSGGDYVHLESHGSAGDAHFFDENKDAIDVHILGERGIDVRLEDIVYCIDWPS